MQDCDGQRRYISDHIAPAAIGIEVGIREDGLNHTIHRGYMRFGQDLNVIHPGVTIVEGRHHGDDLGILSEVCSLVIPL